MSKLGDVMRECLDPDRYVGPLPPGLREDMRAALKRIAELEGRGEMICERSHDYHDGDQTDCPYLSWASCYVPKRTVEGHWLARHSLPPCEKKVCGKTQCNNYGIPYKHANRVVIVASVKEVGR